MKLKKFSVERFRSIVNKSEFPIQDNTVIIGPNNEGKSNILLALVFSLRFLESISIRKQPGYIKNRNIVYDNTTNYRKQENGYDWERDFPVNMQEKSHTKGKKNSTFILTFELTQEERKELKKTSESNLKNIPIKLEAFPDQIRLSLNKPGHFSNRISSEKINSIAKFITDKINICYIGAIRTADDANYNILQLLNIQLKQLEESEEYKKALDLLKSKREPLLNSLSDQVNNILKDFIPNIKSTEIQFYENARYRSYSRDVDIFVDDGMKTSLQHKGTGIQSLIALSIAQFVSLNNKQADSFIIAIEEPESHLHPDAIHKLKEILANISAKNQLIITTHSPLLANTHQISSDIIVKDNKAKIAKHKSELKNILGVKISDNLISAEQLLLVEGESDKVILEHLFFEKSNILKEAITTSRLVIFPCNGVDKIEFFSNFMKYNLCSIHILVDGDDAGKNVINKLLKAKRISNSEYSILKINGMKECEIEDIFNPESYATEMSDTYGIRIEDIKNLNFNGKQDKWTNRMSNIFSSNAKIFDENVVKKIKIDFANIIKNKSVQLLDFRTDIVNFLIESIEKKFK